MDTVIYELVGRWARITLNRPDKHNALSATLLDELASVLWEADEDREVHAVLLRGAGPSFCSGYDLGRDRRTQRRVRDSANKFRGITSADDDIWQIERNQRAMLSIFDMHKPVVAQVHGNCLAGGIDLMMLCDLVIAAEDARIAFPPARSMGTLPINMWLWHIPAQWAKRLLFTGDSLSGADAACIGLVLDAVPAAELDAECERLMDRLSLVDADILAANKRSVNLAMELMGARTMQRLAAELDGRAHLARSARGFVEVVREAGLKEASRRRDEPFGHDDRVVVRHR
jgi:enoyl-CoA hydratase